MPPIKSYIIFIFLFFSASLKAQKNHWQQQADFVIDVQLNEHDKTLTGFEKIVYTNNAPDTLTFIWFHIWPNAYKHDKTAFSDQLLQNGNNSFYFSNKDQKGYINRLDFRVEGIAAKTEDHPQHIDIIKVLLPQPLPPGGHISITTPFAVKLPYDFSRGGFSEETFQLTQWYPKPAVYDQLGWHPMPYLDQGEFYSEFGNYDVRITVPNNYVTAATGELQNKDEWRWEEARAHGAPPKKILPKSKATVTKKSVLIARDTSTKTLRFLQNNVHDFAIFLNKEFIVKRDTCLLPSGKIITVASYYTNKEALTWKNSIRFIKDAVRFYSNQVGEYPYNTISAVQGPKSFGGGMEYPTITVISPANSEKELDIVLAHEIGHNWFYGILASNERSHPWMDEGLNSFYEKKYVLEKYGPQPQWEEVLFRTAATRKKDQPISTSSEAFSTGNYGLVAYHKTAVWLSLIEQKIGAALFKKAMGDYFRQWQFKHPQPEDLKWVLGTYLGADSSEVLSLLDEKGLLPGQKASSFTIVSPVYPKSFTSFLAHPSKNPILLSPAVGINNYDKLMVGGIATNYTLPPASFQFLIAPLYATGSKKAAGIAKLNYTVVPDRSFDKVSISLSGLMFSKNSSLDSNGKKVFERFYKLSPALRFTFLKGPLSSSETWVEARTYIITESEFDKFVTKYTDGRTYVDSNALTRRYVNQLTFSSSNNRSLYPYDYSIQLQQGKGFYRTNFTGSYFFNYANGGGAGIRLFAAKFGYLNKNRTNNYQAYLYQPKLLGNTGEEDYTYSNYFFGRTASYANENVVKPNGGLAAQQIMVRDGGMKLRIDQYDFLQGRSEDWVAAINLNTSLPPKLFPVKLPLKLFLDFGTYAEAWKEDPPTSRILYVGGLQFSLLKDIVNVYVPVLYSSDFRTYLKTLPEQNTLGKKITFSIDLHRVTTSKLFSNSFQL